MKRRLAVVLLFAGLSSAEEPGAFSDLGFDAACKLAADRKKILVVDFFTTWCGPCKKLDKVTWHDEKVVAWLKENAVALKIDAEAQEALATKYRVSAYPTVLLLRADGTEIDRLVGYREPAEFLHDAGEALAGRDSLARAKAKLEGDGARNPTLRQDYGEALEERGRDAEALVEYLWCYDHGAENDPAYGSVRLTFLLGRIAALSAGHPPALEALRTRRDASAKRVLSGSGTQEDAAELAALDRGLDREDRTLQVYDELAKKEGSEKLREALRGDLFDALVAAKRYAELAGGAEEAVEQLFSDWKEAAAEAEKEKTEDAVDEADFERSMVVERGSAWFEVLLGTGKKEAAAVLAERIVKASPSGEAWAALIGRAVHAGDDEAARAFAEAGLKAVTGEDADLIREAAKGIPEKK